MFGRWVWTGDDFDAVGAGLCAGHSKSEEGVEGRRLAVSVVALGRGIGEDRVDEDGFIAF